MRSDIKIKNEILDALGDEISLSRLKIKKRSNIFYWSEGHFNYGYKINIHKHNGISRKIFPSYLFEDTRLTRALRNGEAIKPFQYVSYECRLQNVVPYNTPQMPLTMSRHLAAHWLFASNLNYDEKSRVIVIELEKYLDRFKENYGSRAAIPNWDEEWINENRFIQPMKAVHFALEQDYERAAILFHKIKDSHHQVYQEAVAFLQSKGIS